MKHPIKIKSCLHIFDKRCLQAWVIEHNKSTCPVCRVTINPILDVQRPESPAEELDDNGGISIPVRVDVSEQAAARQLEIGRRLDRLIADIQASEWVPLFPPPLLSKRAA